MITIIICTHNPRRDYLQRTLDGLKAQTLSRDRWEFLLIDNASREPVSAQWDLTWHQQARHVREDEVGLTAARLRGIREAKGNLLVFVDDDNVLEPDFLARALDIHDSHPFLGVFGAGVLEPEFETKPPANIASRVALLALRQVRTAQWSNRARDASCIPWGAGLCVTRRVADAYLELLDKMPTMVLDRRGRFLFSGGDDVFSWASVWAGFGFGIFPSLRIRHLISSGRVTEEYFLRMYHDHAYSHGVLDYLLEGIVPSRIDGMRYARIFLHALRNGVFSARCHYEASKGRAAAARLINENGLRSIRDELKGSAPGRLQLTLVSN